MSDKLPFADSAEVPVRALYVGERIDLRDFESAKKLGVAPLTVAAGAAGVAVLFRYGVIVLYNISPIEQTALLGDLAPLIHEPTEKPETEDAILRTALDRAERGEDGVIVLRHYDCERLQLVADVLAKSVVLGHHEDTLAEAFKDAEPLAEALHKYGSSRWRGRELLRHIGMALIIETKTVWRAEVTDKPEILWEEPELELLYNRLVDEYELSERHAALERKLGVVSKTATTALQLLQNNRSLRVEWYIVILIVIEIFITMYQMIFGTGGH